MEDLKEDIDSDFIAMFEYIVLWWEKNDVTGESPRVLYSQTKESATLHALREAKAHPDRRYAVFELKFACIDKTNSIVHKEYEFGKL